MSQYDYEIGSTEETTNLEDITVSAEPGHIIPPVGEYNEYPIPRKRGDGMIVGDGFPTATWNWTAIDGTMLNELREYCTGASAAVYIKTRVPPDGDSGEHFVTFYAIMVWPPKLLEQRMYKGVYRDVTIEFRRLQVVT